MAQKKKKDEDVTLDEVVTEVTEDIITTEGTTELKITEQEGDTLSTDEIVVEDQVKLEEVIGDVVEEEESKVDEAVEDPVNKMVDTDDHVTIKLKSTKSILQSVQVWSGYDEVLGVDNYRKIYVTPEEVFEVQVPADKLDKLVTYYKSLGVLGLVIID